MMHSFAHRSSLSEALVVTAIASAALGAGQFEQIAVPPQMAILDFMIGEWAVEGAFRTPDHIGSDRTLWYLTRSGGVTRFDGTTWTAFAPGQAAAADEVLAQIEGRAAPYSFANKLDTRRAQDGFVLVLDEGRTSGTTIIYFDTAASEWVSTQFHAPTNGVSEARAPIGDALPVFMGRGTDRRGERVFRRRFEIHDQDHFTIRTDVSFDEGTTWIDDQIVQEVRRQ